MTYNYVRNVGAPLMGCSLLIIAIMSFFTLPVFAVCSVEITALEIYECGIAVDEAYVLWTVDVKVTVHNNGTVPLNGSVNAYYYNGSAWAQIGTPQNINNLPPSNTVTVTFSWNLASLNKCTTYTVKANVTATCGDSDTDTTTLYIRLTGDVTGDDLVMGNDIVTIMLIANYQQQVPPANVYADVNGDGLVLGNDIIIIQRIENYQTGCPA